MARLMFGSGNTIVAALLNDLAEYLIKSKQSESALLCLMESLSILDNRKMSDSAAAALVHTNISNCYLALQQFETAETHFTRAMQIKTTKTASQQSTESTQSTPSVQSAE